MVLDDETFRIGCWRKTMDQNELLQKPKLGRCLERGYTLPPGTTFGHANYKQDGGTAGALKYGPLNDRIKSAKDDLELEKDFVKLNRVGIKKGVITARDQKNYRALTDFRVPPPARETRARLQPPPDIVFGKPSRPRSPIYDVIEHKFQRNWLIHQKMRDEARQERAAEETRKSKTVQLNGAVLRRNNKVREVVEPKPLWQMTKFQKQSATVQSFRDDLTRERSFAAYRHQESGRIGTNKRGITVMAST